jgi:hypothetical protein
MDDQTTYTPTESNLQLAFYIATVVSEAAQ